MARLGPLRRSLKCLYLHLHDLGSVQPCSGRGGAWLDRKRVCRKKMDARQRDAPVLIATACQGFVTCTCSIAPARVPARWISFTFRRRLNQENILFIATNPPFDVGSTTTPCDTTSLLLLETIAPVAGVRHPFRHLLCLRCCSMGAGASSRASPVRDPGPARARPRSSTATANRRAPAVHAAPVH